MIVIYFNYTSTSSEADGSRSSATLYLVLEVNLKLQKRMVGKSTEIKYNIFSSIMHLDVNCKMRQDRNLNGNQLTGHLSSANGMLM